VGGAIVAAAPAPIATPRCALRRKALNAELAAAWLPSLDH
jgi:hypothetical protein